MYQLHARRRDNKIVSSTVVTLFLLTSAYYWLTIVDFYRAFVSLRSNPGPLAYINHGYRTILAPIEYLFVIIALFVSDILLVWRCAVIWPTNRVVPFIAALLMTAGLGVGLTNVAFLFEQAMGGDGRNVMKTNHLAFASAAIAVANNFILTATIVGRLSWMARQSGSGYLLVCLVQCIVHAVGDRVIINLTMKIAPALVGLFPTAIVFQLNLQSERTQSSHRVHASPGWRPSENTISGVGGGKTVTEIRFAGMESGQQTHMEVLSDIKADDLVIGITSVLEERHAERVLPSSR